MPRGLDHVIHAVRDLDAAADLYRRLGFTVGPRNRHPWGTHNRIIQIPGVFMELLTLAEPEKLGSDALSQHFGRATQKYLEGQEGLSSVILESTAVAADAAAFAEAGIGGSQVLSFERDGQRADGATVKVGFALAFARDPLAPEVGFAVCKQRDPDTFWNAASQQHANSAATVAGVVLVAENPSDHHIFLSAFTGERELHASSSGITAPTPRGDIRVMDPAAFADRYELAAPDVTAGARLAAIRFEVPEHGALERSLERSGVPFLRHMNAAVVAPKDAFGATLVFM